MFSHGNEHQTFASLCLAVVFLFALAVCNSTCTVLMAVQIQLLSRLQALITPPPAQIQLMSCSVYLHDGPYSGSTFSVLGRNPIRSEVREMPVVGGTGIFRLARGYCLAKTHSMVGFDAIIGYNVTLLHY